MIPFTILLAKCSRKAMCVDFLKRGCFATCNVAVAILLLTSTNKVMRNKLYSYRGVGVYKTQQKMSENRKTAVNYTVKNCIKEFRFYITSQTKSKKTASVLAETKNCRDC